MFKDKSSIQTKFLNKMIYVVFISIGLWCFVWVQGEVLAFRAESKSLRTNYIHSQKAMLQKEVANVVRHVNLMRTQAEKKLEISLKERVDEAHAVAMHIYGQNIGSRPLTEIEKMIKDALRPVRFNRGRGYYFAVSLDGIEQLYPVNPEFEGKNLLDLQDSKGNFVIQDEIEMVKENLEGFVRHAWKKPGKDPANPSDKISFVKYVKPLNWYLGTGEYLDTAKELVQEEILAYLAGLRFGEEGYFFASTFQGDPLVSNGRITKGSGSVLGLTDPNGVKIIQEQIRAANKPEGDFVYYSWKKLNTPALSPKASFVMGVPDWEWSVGAGVYLDTIDQTIAENKTALIAGLKKRVVRSILVLAGVLCLVYFWSRRSSHQIQTSIDRFSSFLVTARTDEMLIDPETIELKEFRDIAVSTNKMLEDRRKAAEKLGKSEEKFRSVFHTSPDAINLNTLEDGVYIEINHGFTQIMGYSRNEVIGKSSTLIRIWEDLEDRDRLVAGLKKDGVVENMEAAFRSKSGHTRIGLMSARLLRIDDQDVILSITRDITGRKQMEADRERFLIAIEQSAEGIVITDTDGTIEYVNPSVLHLTGYLRQELIGQNPRILKSGEQAASVYDDLWATITSGRTWKGRLVNKKKDNSLYTEEVTISPVLDKAGNTMNFVAVKRDITHEIEMEKQLQQSRKMEAIGTLAGGIAHDFNNILFPIVGHTEMLMEDVPPDSPLQGSLTEIYTGALRARDLVQQILAFSRRGKNEPKLMRIQPVIEEALKMLRSTIPTSIEIRARLDQDCGFVKADPIQIHQIVMNLATNAYHAMETHGGQLEVRLKKINMGAYDRVTPDMTPGWYACLSVADTGTGMEKTVTEKIFDPFFTTKETGKGTGMGLSVVHGIVKRLNGAVQVFSRPGKGTRIHVYFPLENTGPAPDEDDSDEPVQGGTEHVLLVDDEDSIIMMERQMLERLGYRVTPCAGSSQALDVFRAGPDQFDLLITDMAMPGMTGESLARELCRIRPELPVLLCTGYSDAISEEKAAFMGIKGFLFKPVEKKDLAQKIREVLDKPNLS